MRYLVLFFFFWVSFNSLGSITLVVSTSSSELDTIESLNFEHLVELDSSENEKLIKTKLVAIALAVTLGYFGVHRLYLGTKPLIPIAYTLTLGGGGFILPLIDIFYIIAAKDIEQITNNDYVFMWNKKKKGI